MNKFSHDKARVNLALLTSLCILFLLPSLYFVTTGASSLAAGLIIASFLVVLINYQVMLNLKFTYTELFAYSIISLALMLVATYSMLEKGSVKPLLSLSIFIPLLCSLCLSRKITAEHHRNLLKTIHVFIWLLLVLGWLSYVVEFDFLNYQYRNKAVFPFSEESHYALAVGFFASAYAFHASLKSFALIMLNLLAQSLLFPNLTLLVFVFVMIYIFLLKLRAIYFVSFIAITGVLAVVTVMYLYYQVPYFSDRLDLSEANNRTSLVYLQGWGLAYLNFIASSGVGLGFQMLGESGTVLPLYTEKIVSIAGQSHNVEDGGFLAAKIIAEFGVFGLLISFLYLVFLISFSFYIMTKNKINKNIDFYTTKKTLLLCFIFCFLVEYYLRGYGYFSPGMVWVIAAFISYHKITSASADTNRSKG